jgi:hypothetical protein
MTDLFKNKKIMDDNVFGEDDHVGLKLEFNLDAMNELKDFDEDEDEVEVSSMMEGAMDMQADEKNIEKNIKEEEEEEEEEGESQAQRQEGEGEGEGEEEEEDVIEVPRKGRGKGKGKGVRRGKIGSTAKRLENVASASMKAAKEYDDEEAVSAVATKKKGGAAAAAVVGSGSGSPLKKSAVALTNTFESVKAELISRRPEGKCVNCSGHNMRESGQFTGCMGSVHHSVSEMFMECDTADQFYKRVGDAWDSLPTALRVNITIGVSIFDRIHAYLEELVCDRSCANPSHKCKETCDTYNGFRQRQMVAGGGGAMSKSAITGVLATATTMVAGGMHVEKFVVVAGGNDDDDDDKMEEDSLPLGLFSKEESSSFVSVELMSTEDLYEEALMFGRDLMAAAAATKRHSNKKKKAADDDDNRPEGWSLVPGNRLPEGFMLMDVDGRDDDDSSLPADSVDFALRRELNKVMRSTSASGGTMAALAGVGGGVGYLLVQCTVSVSKVEGRDHLMRFVVVLNKELMNEYSVEDGKLPVSLFLCQVPAGYRPEKTGDLWRFYLQSEQEKLARAQAGDKQAAVNRARKAIDEATAMKEQQAIGVDSSSTMSNRCNEKIVAFPSRQWRPVQLYLKADIEDADDEEDMKHQRREADRSELKDMVTTSDKDRMRHGSFKTFLAYMQSHAMSGGNVTDFCTMVQMARELEQWEKQNESAKERAKEIRQQLKEMATDDDEYLRVALKKAESMKVDIPVHYAVGIKAW